MAELEDEIRAAAAAPKSQSSDAGSVSQHDLSDLIEASKHLASQDAAAQPHFGVRRSKIVPPGCGG